MSLESLQNYKFGSCGKIIPNVDIKIINKKEDKIGEIWIKGDSVFKGYFEDEKLTNKYMLYRWFDTDDLGYLDKDVYLYIVRRKGSTIVLQNDEKIFPEEIEEKINNINGVNESLVFLDNPQLVAKTVYNELVFDNQHASKTRILEEINRINKSFPQYKRINGMIFSNIELEKNENGKLLRNITIEEKTKKEDNDEISSFDKIKKIIFGIVGEK